MKPCLPALTTHYAHCTFAPAKTRRTEKELDVSDVRRAAFGIGKMSSGRENLASFSGPWTPERRRANSHAVLR